MCMCEQDTWSLRLLLLGGSWGKSPSTGEILCCWAGLNFTSLSAPDCGQTNGTSFFGPGLIVQLGCLMSTFSVHWCVLQWWPRCTGQVLLLQSTGTSCAANSPTPLILATGLWKPCCDLHPAAPHLWFRGYWLHKSHKDIRLPVSKGKGWAPPKATS